MTDVATPISLSEYYPTIPTPTQGDITQPQIPATQPRVHDIEITDVVATNPQTVRNITTSGGLIIGLPESPIRRVTLKRINISSAKAGGTFIRLRNASEITCSTVTVTPLSPNPPSLGHTFDNEGGLSNLAGCDVPPPSM
jgi:polygalacturonase